LRSVIREFSSNIILFITVFVIGMILYLPTLQPSITWYNSGEMVSAAMTLDVPHQPGYPLFHRVANIAVNLPIGREPAWRVNLLCAILGAAACGFLALWLFAGGCSSLISGTSAVWMMTFVTFWEQATGCEVYTLEILLLGLMLISGWNLQKGEIDFHRGALFGATLFLAIGHRTTFFVNSLALIFVLKDTDFFSRVKASGYVGFLIGAALGSLPLLDLYFRLQNPERVLIDPRLGMGLDGFWKVITVSDFRKALGVFSIEELFGRFLAILKFFATDGGIAIVILPAFTLLFQKKSWNPQTKACLWVLMANSGFIMNYNAFEAHTMLMPSVFALCGISAHGLSDFAGKKARIIEGTFVALILITLLNAFTELSPRNRDAENFAAKLTALIPKGGTLLVSNDIEFRPIWYLRLARGFRSDINLRLIDAFDDNDLRSIEIDLKKGDVFGTLVFPHELRETLLQRFHLLPWGYLSRVVSPNPLFFQNPERKIESSSLALPDGSRLSIGAESQIIPMPDFPNPPRPSKKGEADAGDIFSYAYSIGSPTPAISDLRVATFLVGTHDELPSQNGVILGHDVHNPLDGYCGNRLPQELPSSIVFERNLVVPENLRSGRYEVRMLLARSSDRGWKSLITKRLANVDPLNDDGYTELFLLKNALSTRSLIKAGTWREILNAGPEWFNASAPILIGKFDTSNSR